MILALTLLALSNSVHAMPAPAQPKPLKLGITRPLGSEKASAPAPVKERTQAWNPSVGATDPYLGFKPVTDPGKRVHLSAQEMDGPEQHLSAANPTQSSLANHQVGSVLNNGMSPAVPFH